MKTEGFTIKRVIEVLFCYTPLSFYRQPFTDLDEGIGCQPFGGGSRLEIRKDLIDCEKLSDIYDHFVNQKYQLTKSYERQAALDFLNKLEKIRYELRAFLFEVEKAKLPAKMMGEIFHTYLLTFIDMLRVFYYQQFIAIPKNQRRKNGK